MLEKRGGESDKFEGVLKKNKYRLELLIQRLRKGKSPKRTCHEFWLSGLVIRVCLLNLLV